MAAVPPRRWATESRSQRGAHCGADHKAGIASGAINHPNTPMEPHMLKFIEDLFDIVLSIINVLDRNGDL